MIRPLRVILPLMLLIGCESTGNLLYETEASDPLDGWEGSLSEVGINTELDWGPKQHRLLTDYRELLELRTYLEDENKRLQAVNQNLKNQLDNELASLDEERGVRAQAEAETERLRKAIRERDAKILSLSIEKAKLEQDRLRSQIAELDEILQVVENNAVEASAPAPGRQP